MRYLVLGCNGMAGHLISIYLKERGHEVVGFARNKASFVDTIVGDAIDRDALIDAVNEKDWDAIVNCIGILNTYAEKNKADAVYLNSYLPHHLAELTDGTNKQVIHISTDCVFSGTRIGGGYSENDFRDGITFYDRTKALGELEDEKNITLRTSIVGPDINKDGIGLMNWFLQQKDSINGYTKAIWTGQTTLQLAKTVEFASTQRAHGLYNVVPDYSISKYELLLLMNKHLRNNEIAIKPIEGLNLDKSLKRTRWDFEYKIPSYETMMIDLSEWMKHHKYLYPHYNFN